MENKKTTLLLLETGDDFNLNIGDEAYFAAMIDMFKQEMPGTCLVKFSHDPGKTRERYGIDAIYQGTSLFKRFWATGRVIKAIRKCDVYSIGGGQIICDPTIGLAMVLRLTKPFLAILLGKKSIGYALGVGPLHRRYIRWMVQWVFNRMSIVTVRDHYSKELLETIGVRRTIHITSDPALMLQVPPPETARQLLNQRGYTPDFSKPTVIISPYGPAYHRLRSILPAKYQVKYDIWPAGGREKFAHYVAVQADLCNYLVEQYDANILFLSMDSSQWHGGDNAVARQVIGQCRCQARCMLVEGAISPQQLLGLYALGSLLVGSRLHSIILGVTANVPSIPIAFEEKTRSFAQRAGVGAYVIDSADLRREQLVQYVDAVWRDRERVKREIARQVEIMQQEVRDNVTRLKQLLTD